MAEHSIKFGYCIQFHDTSFLARKFMHMASFLILDGTKEGHL